MYGYDIREEAGSYRWWNTLDEVQMTATVKYLSLEVIEEYCEDELTDDQIKEVEKRMGEDDYLTVSIEFDVCDVCQGRGSYVNPAIDSGGISGEEFYGEWDEEDRNAYRRGRYDMQCGCCRGKRVVPVIDKKSTPKWILDLYYERQNSEADYQRVCRMERMMGA